MSNNIPEIEDLIKQFSKLPGLGPKSAKRIILKLISNKDDSIKPLAQSLAKVYKNVVRCVQCGNLKLVQDKCICEKGKLFDKWYMITRDTKLSRMLALLEGQNNEKKKTNVEKATAEDDDIRSITKKSSKLYYGQLHTLLKHGSLDDAMLSTLFFLLQQQQKSMKVLQSVTERTAIS